MCVSALMERVMDPGSRTTTEERDCISRFEGNIPPANGTGAHRARRVFDQRSQPPHCTGLSGEPKAWFEAGRTPTGGEGRISPVADGRKREVLSSTACYWPQTRNYVNVTTWWCLMSPLGSSLMCSPTENLQGSQGILHSARRGARRRPFWHFSTWNVWSLLDSEGSVDTAHQDFDCHQVSRPSSRSFVPRRAPQHITAPSSGKHSLAQST